MKPTLPLRMAKALCHLILTLAFDLKAYGTHNVPRRGGVLLVTNHQSYLDPAILGVPLRRMVSFLARSELFHNRYFGAMIRTLNAFPVQQGRGDTAAIREMIRRLREGQILNIFPEGSRSEDGELAPIERGAALVVRRAGTSVSVVPVAIDGAFQAWPRHRKYPRRHPIRVMYGPPLDIADRSDQEVQQLIGQTLQTMLADLRAKSRRN